MKESLRPLIEQHSVNGVLKCELSFVKLHEDELSLFCLPVDKTDPLMGEQLKRDVNRIASQWALAQNHQFKVIRTRFTDEITAPVKK